MFARTPAHRQYATIGVESQVLGAGDHRLISLLFDGAIEAIDRARTLRETGQAAESAAMTARARTIVTEGLRASLDRHRGGEICVPSTRHAACSTSCAAPGPRSIRNAMAQPSRRRAHRASSRRTADGAPHPHHGASWASPAQCSIVMTASPR